VPANQHLGAQFLVRSYANNTLAVTIRQHNVERVVCPSPLPGWAKVAYLGSATPTTFHYVPLA